MIYLIVIFYVLTLAIKYDREEMPQRYFKRKRTHQVILYLTLSLIAGLSYRLGLDCIRYEMKFQIIDPINNFSTLQLLINSYDLEPLWTVLNSIVKFFSDDFYVLHMVVAVFVNGVIFWFINKYTKYFFTTILLYCLIQYCNYNFEILRESISMSFFLLAIDNIIAEKNNYLRYYLFALPAVFVHAFGVVVLLFPVFKIINVQKHLTEAVIFTLFLTPVLFFLMNKIVTSNFLTEEMSSKMEAGYLGYSSSFNIFGIIISAATIVAPSLFMVYKTKGKVDDGLRSFAFLYPLIIITTYGYYMMYRMGNYMFVPFVLCVSQYIHNAFLKKDARAILLFMLFFLFTTRTNFKESIYRRYIPYSSIIDEQIDSRREQIYNEFIH